MQPLFIQCRQSFRHYSFNDLIHFTLYSRSYCHLCDDMLAALTPLCDPDVCQIDVVDVDADQALVARYDELVPVLVAERGGELVQLCHYFLDVAKVQAFLQSVR